MKNLLILCAALAMFLPEKAHAQWKAFLEVGTTASIFVGDVDADQSHIVRLAGGGGVRYEALNGFELETGISYRVWGSYFVTELNEVPSEVTSETSYVGFPLLFGYRFNRYGTWRPRLYAGPYYAFKIDSRIRFNAVGSDIEQSESDESVEERDLGVSFGFDVNRQLRSEMLSVGIRGTYGLSNARTVEPKYHNMSVGLFAAIVF